MWVTGGLLQLGGDVDCLGSGGLGVRTTLWVVRGPSITESHTTAKWLKCVTPLRTWVDEPEVRDDVYRSTQEYSGPPSSQVQAASKRHPGGGLPGL